MRKQNIWSCQLTLNHWLITNLIKNIGSRKCIWRMTSENLVDFLPNFELRFLSNLFGRVRVKLVDPPDDGRFFPRKFIVKLQNEKPSVRVTAKRFLDCLTFLCQNKRIAEMKNNHCFMFGTWNKYCTFVCWLETVKKYRHNILA